MRWLVENLIFASTQQLATILFDELQLPVIKKKKQADDRCECFGILRLAILLLSID